MDNRITISLVKERISLHTLADRWQFKPGGRWAWLQRQAWKLLLKTDALTNAIEEQITVERLHIDGDKALEAIMKQCQYAFEQFGRKPSKVYIGGEDMAEIMHDAKYNDLKDAIDFTGRAGYGQTVFGLPVKIVPHMRGCLVV